MLIQTFEGVAVGLTAATAAAEDNRKEWELEHPLARPVPEKVEMAYQNEGAAFRGELPYYRRWITVVYEEIEPNE